MTSIHSLAHEFSGFGEIVVVSSCHHQWDQMRRHKLKQVFGDKHKLTVIEVWCNRVSTDLAGTLRKQRRVLDQEETLIEQTECFMSRTSIYSLAHEYSGFGEVLVSQVTNISYRSIRANGVYIPKKQDA